MPLTTAQAMAVAILQGDEQAAVELAEMLVENRAQGTYLPPVKHLSAKAGNLRFIFHMSPETVIDREAFLQNFHQNIMRWLRGNQTLAVTGIDRVDIYELSDETIQSAKEMGVEERDYNQAQFGA